MFERDDTVRSAEQVASDLGKGLQFSVSDLQLFRRGILPAASCSSLLQSVTQPLAVSAALTLAPLFVAALITSSLRHCSPSEALVFIFSTIFQVKEFAGEHGWFSTILYGLAGLGLLGAGAYYASRIPMDVFADIVEKRVRTAEGRVTAREQEKLVHGKRDDVTVYYFEMKERTFQVSRQTFLALDAGGLYRVYYLPRSLRLVAIEPSVLAREAEEREKNALASSSVPSI